MAYDPNNVFARILRGELKSVRAYEDNFAVAFYDNNPRVSVHIIVVPRGPYCSWSDFSMKATDEEIAGFMRAVAIVAERNNLEASGYRLITNHGANSGQEVPHFHMHLLGGQRLGPILDESCPAP